MNTVEIFTGSNESTAVATGKAILAAGLPVKVGETIWGMSEDQYSELQQYLSRRNVNLSANADSDMVADWA